MAVFINLLRLLDLCFKRPIRAWIAMVEQQSTLLGTLFALSLPILFVSMSGTLYWSAFYYLGSNLGLVVSRWYGETTLFWLRSALLAGFGIMFLFAVWTRLRQSVMPSWTHKGV